MMSKQEATDTIMATLGEYDALWDGELFPEEEIDRLDAMAALIGAVTARVENSLDATLFTEEVDAELYDVPLDDQTFIDCFIIDPPEDFPSARSLK
jgi:hypothetical protein